MTLSGLSHGTKLFASPEALLSLWLTRTSVAITTVSVILLKSYHAVVFVCLVECEPAAINLQTVSVYTVHSLTNGTLSLSLFSLSFYTHTNTRAHTHTHTHTRTHARARARTHIHAHTHSLTHTHTHSLLPTWYQQPAASEWDQLFLLLPRTR